MKQLLGFLFFIIPLSIMAQSWSDLTKQGVNAYNGRDYQSALEYYTKAYNLIVKEEGKKGAKYNASLNNLGQVYRELGDFKKSRMFFEEALTSREKEFGKNNMEYIIVLANYGTLCRLEGKLDDAYKANKEALDLANALFGKDHLNTAMFHNNLGRICLELSKYKEAESHYSKSLELVKINLGEMNLKYTTCLNNLGNVYERMGEFDKSEPLLLRACEITKSLSGENSIEYALAMLNIGNFYSKIGDYGSAESYLMNSLDILKTKVDKSDYTYISNLSSLGANYINLRNYTKAKQYLLEAMTIANEYHSHQTELYPNILQNLAMSYTKLDSLPQAEFYLLTAIKLQKEVFGENNLIHANELQHLGRIYGLQNRLDEAEIMYKSSIVIYEKLFGKDYGPIAVATDGLAGIQRLKGKPLEAQKLYEKSILLFEREFGVEHPDYINGLLNLVGIAIANKDYIAAVKYFRKCLPLYKNYFVRATTFLSAGELNQLMAIEKFKLAALESFERILLNHSAEIVGDMFEFRLMIDGLQLRNSTNLRQAVMQSNDTSLVGYYKEWVDYNYQISFQLTLPLNDRNPQLNEWTDKLNALEKKLVKGSKEFNRDYNLTSINISWARDQLKEGDALIKFISFPWYDNVVWSDSVLYAALVFCKQDSLPVYIPLFEERQLKGLLKGDTLRTFANLLYSDAQVRDVERNISYGDSVYQLIWNPITPYLNGITHIKYIPTGLLHKLTLDAIPLDDQSTLSDLFQFTRLISANALQNNASESFTYSSTVMFGGIEYDIDTTEWRGLVKGGTGLQSSSFPTDISRGSNWGRWSYLQGSKREVDNLTDILNKSGIKVSSFEGKLATEENFKLLNGKPFDIIHISTHGFYFPKSAISKVQNGIISNSGGYMYSEDPLLRNGLIFSGANYVWEGNKPLQGVDDGIVTAMDISGLYLPSTRLVVLSACETGLGDIGGNEGVYGLQRAFKIAGVEYMIVTLWPVLDKETSEFMTMFYTDLISIKNIPEAFRSTQNKMKEKYSDEPYKWAGFVLVK